MSGPEHVEPGKSALRLMAATNRMGKMKTFENNKRNQNGKSSIRGIVSTYRGRILLLSLIAFGGALLEAALLVLITGVAMALASNLDAVGPYLGRTLEVGNALLLGGAALILRLLFNLLAVFASASLTAQVTTDQRRILSSAYLNSNWAIHQGEPSGRLQELLTSFVGRVNLTVQALSSALTALMGLIAFVGTSLAIDSRATIAAVSVLLFVGAVLLPIRRVIKRLSAVWTRADLAFANAVSELGALGLEMQTFGVRDEFEDRIESLTRASTAAQKRAQIASSAQNHLYMALAYGAVLGGIAVSTGVGFDDLAVIGTILLLMLRSLSYGQALSAAGASLATYAPFLDRVREAANHYLESPARNGDRIPGHVTPIEATNLRYSYSSNRPALNGVTFRIDRGDVVGVIGPSGAGKSTIAQMLLGLREPTSGAIHVEGIDLRDVDRAWWSQRVAFVPQDALLISGTIAENIRFFRSGIDDNELRRAAAQANLLADIDALPEGFETDLGARGSQLSGGQRQRLSIARALVGRPEFLILDEPTSALDGESEALVSDSIDSLRGEIAVVLIAHRMSTLEVCDTIIVIEDGKLTALGTPSELRRSSSFYRRAIAIAGGDASANSEIV